MEQTCLYDYLDKQDDPLYRKILLLKKGEDFYVDIYKISLNLFGLYEVTCHESHIAFSSRDECYRFLNKKINESQLNRINKTN
ncbi:MULTISPECIES: hypothetical protein [Siminovitchia]|uniref:Uncharacterized protein n=1 Tax=Siminovitchia sediminis TaxID=1274353 RepID=A0ABW4KIC2_9BACI|nr:hypothetical protein [Siminovitchia fortis]